MQPNQIDALLKDASSNPELLGELLRRYRPYLRLVAERSLGSGLRRREDASDVLQRTELDVVSAIQDFRGNTEPEFSAWVRQILKRNIASIFRHHRAAKRDFARECYLEDEDGSATVSWAFPVANGQSPSQRAIRGEAALRLAAAIDELPEKQRLAVQMRHLEGKKIDEVSKSLGVTPGAAAGLIRRGVEALREAVEDDLRPP